MDFTLEEQAALEAFGNAWARLLKVEEAVKAGHGASFTHATAAAEMQQKAKNLRDVMHKRPDEGEQWGSYGPV